MYHLQFMITTANNTIIAPTIFNKRIVSVLRNMKEKISVINGSMYKNEATFDD